MDEAEKSNILDAEPNESSQNDKKLFSSVKFFLAQCNNPDDIKNILVEHGATQIKYLTEGVTHAISDIDCPEAEEAAELYDKPVVNSLWIHMSLKTNKLLPCVAFSPLKTIFQDVVVSFSSDLEPHDIDILAASLTFYGAHVTKNQSASTHLIASGPDDTSARYQHQHDLKIVAPDWVLESIKNNQRLDEQSFNPKCLLPPPPPTPPEPEPEPIKQNQPSPTQDQNNVPKVDNQPSLSQSVQTPQKVFITNAPQTPRPRSQANIRLSQPRFRPSLPVNNSSIVQRSPSQPQHHIIQQHQVRPIPQQQPFHVQPTHQRLNIPTSVPTSSGNMAYHNTLPQPNAYNQVRPPLQYHSVPRGPPIQNPQQINRFQDPSYQSPVQQNIHRQPVYYNQNQRHNIPTSVPTSSSNMNYHNTLPQPNRYNQVRPQPQYHGPPRGPSAQNPEQMNRIPEPSYQTPVQQNIHRQPVYYNQNQRLNPPASVPTSSGNMTYHNTLPQPNMYNQVRPQQQPQYHSMPRGPTVQNPQPLNRIPDPAYQSPAQQNLQRQPIYNNQNPSPQPITSLFGDIKSKVPVVVDSPPKYYGHEIGISLPENKPLIGCRLKIVDYDDHLIRSKIIKAVKSAGGSFDEDIEKLTHLICENRLSETYKQALASGVRCVTIYWLHDIISKNRLIHPWKALHLPLAFAKDDRPLHNEMIAITNISDKTRRYVKEMISKTGARYTQTLIPSNTLLICGDVGGEKYEHAIEWRTPIASIQLLTDYLLGSQGDIMDLLSESKYQIFRKENPSKIYSYTTVQELMRPWEKPIKLVDKIESDAENMTNGECKSPRISLNSNDSGIVTSGSHVSETEVAANKIKSAEPVPPSTVTTNDLNDDATVKNQLVPVTCDDLVKFNGKSMPRRSNETIHLMFTHLDTELRAQLGNQAKALGMQIATRPKDCTHLIVDCISRTPTFVSAFSHAKHFLSYKWIIESHENNQILEEKGFIIEDKDGQETYCFDMDRSIRRRDRRTRLLFEDYIIFLTPNVVPSASSVKEMIESAGGTVMTRKRPTFTQIKQIKLKKQNFVVVSCKDDYDLFQPLISKGIDILTPEFVICGILRQEIDHETHRLCFEPDIGLPVDTVHDDIDDIPIKKKKQQ